MLHFVLPEFAAIYRSFNTPPSSDARYYRDSAMGVGMGLAHLVPDDARCYRSPQGKTKAVRQTQRQRLLLRLPVMGRLIRGQKLAQIFTVLALTQSAGIPFLQGLESAIESLGCPYWSQRLTQVHQEIAAGNPVWLALKIPRI